MKRLIAASGNPGKLREFEQVLKPLGFEIIPQYALGITDAEEPHQTFVENALAKARHASRRAGLAAFADDSGICVAALGGAPGVYSARYAAEGAVVLDRDTQDRRNNEKLVGRLVSERDRRAHYYCVLVLMRHAEDPEPLIAEGRWHGEVMDAPRGANGFGYDPYFYVPRFGCTAAELSAEQKNSVSHRGHALRALAEKLSDEHRV